MMQQFVKSLKALHKTQPKIIIDLLIIHGVFITMLFLLFKKLLPMYYYPAWDQAHHLLVALGYYESFIKLSPGIFWNMFLRSDTIYPPLFHISTALGYVIFGIRENIALIVNFPFMLLLSVSTYLLARETTSRQAAIYSGILVFFVPLFINLWTDAMTDISSVALFITLYWLVLKTNYFRSTKWSLLCGVAALGLLLARYAFFNAALPLIIYAVVSIRKNRSVALINLLSAAIITLPAVYWYTSHWTMIHDKLTFFGDPNNYPVKIYGLPTVFEARNWLYFLDASIRVQGIGLIPMLLFGASVVARHFKKIRFGGYLLGTIVCNFLVQTIWLDKIPKYIEYSYPIILILTLSWITSIRKGSQVMLLILFGAMLTNFSVSLFALPIETPVGRLSPDHYVLPGIRYEYDYVEWPIASIVADIPVKQGEQTRVLLLTDTETLNSVTLMYYAVHARNYFSIIPPFDLYDPARPRVITENDLRKHDFILTKSEGDLGVFVNYDTTYAINALISESDSFTLMHEYNLPDGTKALLYKISYSN